MDVGLGYLTLDRACNTLSGGESQRINLVTALGSSLVGSMYILNEPSIGLHPRDTERLIGVLRRLRDIGNTVIVVEHDEEIIRAADLLIDMGPLAGVNGGNIVFSGKAGEAGPEDISKSLTLQYLNGQKLRYTREKRPWQYSINVDGAMEHNLKDINVRFPLGVLTVVTGVSGSGKSTLVGDILYPALYRRIHEAGDLPGTHRGLSGNLDRISRVEYVDQNPIGRSSRSNAVTYLKAYDGIRKLMASQQAAKIAGLTANHFSFNTDGGRCPECQGEGVVRIGMQFMADVEMVCEECGGKRFKLGTGRSLPRKEYRRHPEYERGRGGGLLRRRLRRGGPQRGGAAASAAGGGPGLHQAGPEQLDPVWRREPAHQAGVLPVPEPEQVQVREDPLPLR